MCSLSLTVDDVCCDLPVTEPVSFHGHITVSATAAFLPPDPECGTLYLKNSDRTQASDSLGANWNRICLSRLLNHGALWQIVFLRLINILTYLLTYLLFTDSQVSYFATVVIFLSYVDCNRYRCFCLTKRTSWGQPWCAGCLVFSCAV